MADNLEITKQITKLMKEQQKLLDAQTKSLKSQADIMQGMVKAMKEMNPDEMAKGFENANEAAKEAAEHVEEAGNKTVSLNEAAKQAAGMVQKLGGNLGGLGKYGAILGGLVGNIGAGSEGLKNMAQQAGAASDGFDNMAGNANKFVTAAIGVGIAFKSFKNFFTSGISFGVSVTKSLISVFTTLTGVAFNLASAILSIPFKMMNALMNEAGRYGGTEFRQAIEDVRKEFGELATNEAQAVIKGFRQMRGDLAETGISVWRAFGNRAERLKAVTEAAKQMGTAFSVLQDEVRDNAERILAYKKGLGLTEEGMKGVADRAIAAGKSFQEVGRDITKFAFDMGDAFGINGKLIARDIGTMMKNFKDFGGLGTKTLAQVATFTRKLGIEVKDLQGIIGKFDDFENAAMAAAQLGQAFGMSVDALEMMNEQDPAKRFENLRQSFLATGKSVDQLTRQQRNLLAEQTGLTDDALLKAFSDQTVSYEQIQKESEKAENKQITQAEAMDRLAMSIDRIVKSGEKLNGFFDAFFKGILRGIRRTPEFRRMMISLNRALRSTFMAGMALGRALVRTWPGVKEVLNGFTDFFRKLGSFTEKGKAKGFFKEVANTLGAFFAGPITKERLEKFYKIINEKFLNIFDLNKGPGKRIIEGFKKFFKTMGQIFKVGLEFIGPMLRDGLNFIADFIRNPNEALGNAQSAAGGFIKFFADVFGPVWKELANQWKTNLKPALLNVWDALWTNVRPILVDMALTAFKWIALASFGVGLLSAMKTAVLGFFLLGAKKIAFGMLRPKLGKIFGGALGGAAQDAVKKASAMTGGGSIGKTPISKTATEMDVLRTQFEKSGANKQSFLKLGNILKAMGAALLAGVAFAAGLKAVDAILGEMTKEQTIRAMAVMGAGIAGTIAMAAGMKMLSGVSIGAGANLALVIAAVFGTSVLMATNFRLLSDILTPVNEQDITNVGLVMSGMTGLYFAIGAGLVGLAAAGAVMAGPQLIAMGVGLVAIAGTTVLMAENFKLISDLLMPVNPGDITKNLTIMTAMTTMYAEAGLVLGGATVIGTMAVFGWPAMLAGVAVIQKVMMGMTDTAIELMNKLKDIPATSAFESKVNSFSRIMGSMSEFAGSLTEMLDVATPRFTSVKSFFFGDSEKSVEKMLKPILGVVKGLTNMGSQIINDITDAVAFLKPEELKSAAVFAQVFESLGKLAGALQPPKQILDNLQGEFIDIAIIKTMEKYISSISTVLSSLMFNIQTIMATVASLNFTSKDLTAIGAFTNLMSAAGQLLSALSPNSEVGKLLLKSVDQSSGMSQISAMVKKELGLEKEKDSFKLLNDHIKGMVDILVGKEGKDGRAGGILNTLKDFGVKVAKSVQGIDPGKMKMGIDMIVAVVNVSKTLMNMPINKEPVDLTSMFQNFTNNIVTPFSENIDAIALGLQSVGRNVMKVRKAHVGRTAKAVSDIVGEINEINTLLADIKPIEIDANLQKLGNKLGLKDSKIRIERGDLKMNVTVNVKVDGKTLADAIKEKGNFTVNE